MTELREEMDRLADQVTTPTPDPALWDRGRRLRRRDRLATSAAALAVIVLVGGLTSLFLVPPQGVAPADGPGADGRVAEGAIPSRIEAAPSHLDGPGTDSLAVGRASLAYLSTEGTFLISATDGSYHRVALPQQGASRTLRLSPDGRQLAYAFVSPSAGDQGATRAGVAVVDLASGDVEQVPAVSSGGTSVDVTSIGWSADSRWVAWSGHDVVSWEDVDPVRATTGSMGALDTTSMVQSTTYAEPGAVSISDAGTLTLINREAQIRFDPTTSRRERVRFPAGVDVFAAGEVSERATTSPDGSLTAIGLTTTTGAAPFIAQDGTVLSRTLAEDLYPRGARVTPLGWVTSSLVLGYVEPDPGSGAYGGDAAALALFTSPDRPTDQWTYRFVVRGLPDITEVSVAVDLVPDLDGTSSQQLTHDFPRPDWPMSPGRLSLLIGLGVAAAWSLLHLLRRIWRRLRG